MHGSHGVCTGALMKMRAMSSRFWPPTGLPLTVTTCPGSIGHEWQWHHQYASCTDYATPYYYVTCQSNTQGPRHFIATPTPTHLVANFDDRPGQAWACCGDVHARAQRCTVTQSIIAYNACSVCGKVKYDEMAYGSVTVGTHHGHARGPPPSCSSGLSGPRTCSPLASSKRMRDAISGEYTRGAWRCGGGGRAA